MIIFLDLDGVLVDFELGYKRLTGEKPNGLIPEKWQQAVIDYPGNFWAKLPWKHDGPELWEYVKTLQPHILSAQPEWDPTAYQGKLEWLHHHLGYIPLNRVNIVHRKHKQLFAKGKNLLIDDYEKNIKEWKAKGGIGIHHVGAKSTISKLQALGFHK